MKSELKAKFLQHLLSKKKNNEGFTLIELLVVIIIIGILAAIALPSFLNQAAKAKQSEAKSYVGAINRAQQSYRIEKPVFASDIVDLEIGIPTTTVDYSYSITGDAATGDVQANPTDATTLRAYSGQVAVLPATGQSQAYACQSTQPAASIAVPDATLATATAACVGGEPMR